MLRKVAALLLRWLVFAPLAWILDKLQASPEKTAQFAHAGVGAALVFILALLFLPLGASAELVLLFAALKEFVEYRWGIWEPRDSWHNSTRDFVFWAVGVLIAVFVLAMR